MKYQLVAVGSLSKNYVETLETSLAESMDALGLDRHQYFEVLNINQREQIDWDGLPVMVWFGGNEIPEPEDSHLLDYFLKKSLPIFPVVEDLSNYPVLVPPELHRINGLQWNLERLTTDLLRAFRLCRQQRQAFISYRRLETRNVAVQLFSALSLHGYRVFLDTASVDSGVDFQEALWGRMADVDLLILLDSPGALSSQWVYQELVRANDLGLGVLQLIWPGHSRTPGTEFCDPTISLNKTDFVNSQADLNDYLTDSTVSRVLSAAETARIRSLGLRRMSVVGELVDQAKLVHLDAEVHPVDGIKLYCGSNVVGSAIPITGLPDALSIQQQEGLLQLKDLSRTRIIYMGLGADPDYTKHLDWLNQKVGLLTCQVDLLDDWLKAL
ncbi:toll/interleukin-1 receptor domain-containing protein [Dendronalium sp. ChiSLP03b]|uniref:toll/interleukin-1 receptor domain-containing protein n=1 Tax=Dendronalium sp. ChiSLP03b TaxID=3075381 RepID=UPI002AD2524B|nr:toll/interleukin-1 receptor domain-containing protein [Dendronalium sp. ChiSLP03b]MDZ8203910.1 toll/interleukin-1 receptor domain-containing protein [Dendronalium sp. ChiSLP03b]